MLHFALRRLGGAAIVVVIVVTIMFTLTRLMPGDPMIGDSERLRADPGRVERLRSRFGLDQPLPVQYLRYGANVLRGDLGESFVMHRPVAVIIRERLPNTLLLAAAALLIGFSAGIAVAAVQARRPGTAADGLLGAASLTLYSTPSFWLGMVLLFVFAQQLGWLPASGMTEPVLHQRMGPLGRAADVARHMILPALTLGLVQIAVVSRFARAALVDAFASEHVKAARAAGIGGPRLLLRALRVSLAPVITLAGTTLGALLAGSVLVETVFGWPGMGRLAHDAIFNRDYNVVAGTALVAGITVALANMLADLAAHAADPRLPR